MGASSASVIHGHTRTALTFTVIALVGALSACTTATGNDTASQRELRVFAAASLTDTFTTLANQFEATHPGVNVTLTFDGSSGLATHIIEGSPADVFAAADTTTMRTVTDAGFTQHPPTIFTSNSLTVAVPTDNPAHITTWHDITRTDITLVVCAPQVPCGAATQHLTTRANIALHPASEEQSVTDVLGKITTGEADAGIVYTTDIQRAAGDVTAYPIPDSANVSSNYPIAALTGGQQTELANEFVEYILDDTAQHVLNDAGFTPAP